MKTETQLKVQAYLDNELSASEARKVAQMVHDDPEARELFTELKDTRTVLLENEPVVQLPETREFYWSKIERGIRVAEREPARAPVRPWWVRLVAPVAGAVALFAILLSISERPGSLPGESLASVSVPLHEAQHSGEVSTITFRSEAEGVTVVWVSSH